MVHIERVSRLARNDVFDCCRPIASRLLRMKKRLPAEIVLHVLYLERANGTYDLLESITLDPSHPRRDSFERWESPVSSTISFPDHSILLCSLFVKCGTRKISCNSVKGWPILRPSLVISISRMVRSISVVRFFSTPMALCNSPSCSK